VSKKGELMRAYSVDGSCVVAVVAEDLVVVWESPREGNSPNRGEMVSTPFLLTVVVDMIEAKKLHSGLSAANAFSSVMIKDLLLFSSIVVPLVLAVPGAVGVSPLSNCNRIAWLAAGVT
jgi:hypothetical protein